MVIWGSIIFKNTLSMKDQEMMKTTTKPCVTIRLIQSFKQANSVTIFCFYIKKKNWLIKLGMETYT